MELVFTYVYPRLDINVSKQLNHLLKSPFVIHPKSGKVCVPIDAAKADHFRPEDVPTIGELVAEVNAHRGAQNDDGPLYEKTKLLPYIKLFQSFVNNLIAAKQSKATSNAMSVDF